MSVTIDSLDIQIRSSAGSAAKNIEELAQSLTKLRESAKLTAVTNNLSKLSDALGKLQSSSADMSKLKSLADNLAKAMNSLTQLKSLSGVSSALNSMKRIPEIIKQLDTGTMSTFTVKMRELAGALAPLAIQMEKIGSGFARLPNYVGKAVTVTNRMAKASRDAAAAQDEHTESLDASRINMAAWISNAQAFVQGLQTIVQKISATMADAIEWDGIQFRFGRAFGEDAEEVLAYAEKLSDVLLINQQQFMQYSSMFGSLLSGFGMEQDKITDISVGLTELSYDIWAAYNDRYKTYEDAFEAVRSAITGEIEPIRNAGIALTEASMQEYLDSIGMAHVSIEKLTEAQKSEVRYAVMVNSAMDQGIVGTYAKEMNTAEGAVRTLTQQLKTLKQAFGSLLIPILQIVVPWITAFVQVLTDAVYWLAELFGIEIQKISWGDTTKGVGGLATGAEAANDALTGATEAAKKLKSYTMGFDELNVINPSSDASGSGAGAGDEGWGSGLDLESLWDNSILEQASQKVEKIKEKILEWKEPIIAVVALLGTAGVLGALYKIGGAVGEVYRKFTVIKDGLKAFFGALAGSKGATSALAYMSPLWSDIAAGITTAAKAIAGFVGGLSAVAWIVIAAIIIAIVASIVFLKRNWEKMTEIAKRFFEINIAAKWEEIKKQFEGVKEAFRRIGEIFAPLTEAWRAAGGWGKVFELLGGVIVSVVSTVIGGALSSLATALEGIVTIFRGVVEVIGGLIRAIVAYFNGDLEESRKAAKEIFDGIVNIFKGLWRSTVGAIVEFVKGVIDWFTELWDVLVGHSIVPDTVEAIIEWFKELPKQILGVVQKFCDDVKQFFVNLWVGIKSWWSANVAPVFTLAYWQNKFGVIKTAMASKLDEVRQTVAEKWNAIKGWFTGSIVPKFTLTFWLDKFKNLKEGFTQTIKNAVNAGIDLMNKFIGWLNEKLNFSWDGLTIAGKTIFEGGSIQLFTIPSIPRLENGGFLEDGLFTMNHGEIAGKFSNGKSVVANNQQIVEGIAAGVYEAVVAAMNATNGRQGQSVNVYLDGKQITAAVEKRQSERGMQLIGNQLGYAY